MKKTITALLAGTALTAGSAFAEKEIRPVSFNYAEIGYTTGSLETGGSDFDFDGFSLRLSQTFGEKFFAFGSYTPVEFDDKDESTESNLGLGIHLLKNETRNPTEVILKASYEHTDTTPNGASKATNLDGFGLRLGFRSMAWERIEIGAEAGLDKFDDREKYVFTGLMAFHVIKNLAVIADYRYEDVSKDDGDEENVKALTFGVRAMW